MLLSVTNLGKGKTVKKSEFLSEELCTTYPP